MQFDAHELNTRECEVTFYEKIIFEFQTKLNHLHTAHQQKQVTNYSHDGYLTHVKLNHSLF